MTVEYLICLCLLAAAYGIGSLHGSWLQRRHQGRLNRWSYDCGYTDAARDMSRLRGRGIEELRTIYAEE